MARSSSESPLDANGNIVWYLKEQPRRFTELKFPSEAVSTGIATDDDGAPGGGAGDPIGDGQIEDDE